MIGLEINKQFGVPYLEQIKLFKHTGFDAFFAYWQRGMDISELRKAADEHNMFFQSLHAPQGRVHKLWYPDESTPDTIAELIECIEACAEYNIPTVVIHTFFGFGMHTPTEEGLNNYDILVKRAHELGIRVAFENAEGEEYLYALIEKYHDDPMVGFCWDVGHEMCYTGYDILERIGDKLFMTHLNDNNGITPKDGSITAKDDIHLVPLDGKADWNYIVDRLNRHGYNDVLMFELKIVSQPGRHDNDKYLEMELSDYLKFAFERCRYVAELKEERKPK